jgi:hypothetical protein
MPLSRFFHQCISSVEKWSQQYAKNDRKFIESPTINLEHWTNGYHWAKSNKEVFTKSNGDLVEYYCPVGENIKVTEDEVKNVKEMRWNTFDQFKRRASPVWIVVLPNGDQKWQEGKCTCPCFLKKYMCKHIIGLAIRLKLAKPPPAAKDVPIGEKRRRGRSRKSTKALLID